MVILQGNITVSEDNVITTPEVTREATDCLGQTMFTHMKNNKDKIAQIDANTGQKDTYRELLQRCIRTALHMTDKNITKDHIVTLCTTNHLNSVVPFIATQFIGARVASLDPSFSQKEMSYLLKQVRPKILFVIPEVATTIENILKEMDLDSEIVIFGTTNNYTKFSDFLRPHDNENQFKPIKIENLFDTAIIYFSSGTSGLPKGICINHYAFITQVLTTTHTENPDYQHMASQAIRVSFPLTMLAYTSLYWVSAGALLLSSIIDGYCRLICSEFDGAKIWNFFEKYKPVGVLLTPVQAIEMLAKKPDRNFDVNSILSIVIMGSGISKEYALKLKQEFPKADFVRPYGQTEVSGGLTVFRANDVLHRSLMQKEERIESVGLPIRGMSYKVVDCETNKNLGPNQKGELRVKSKYIMNGYYNVDSSASFDEDGWLKTGDVVYYDEDYCFYVVDRIKESFKYQGWFIAPATLENELLNHPAVLQAVVIGIPKDDGHHPMGLVVLKENVDASAEEIEKFVEERVPERQRLRAGVKILKSLPLTVTGKIKRVEVKKMILGENNE
ncbi:luciferin 4-monooxygenase-like isoform X2 [Tribolium madens]|uniref:luciferin 4-monooxygenase-like isoform X2 n=1 Tax=Tribolium madens TaxID=41895 RepID=UPI001CF75CB2|nr:luciferin 4-monooxygenase-like isoform X2 [Tribolium madens]